MKNLFYVLLAVVAVSLTAQADTLPATKDVVIGVNDVYVPGGFDSQTDAYVVVSGIFPNGCYRWKGAHVNHVANTTHEVTSVASVTQGMCIQVLIPFTKDVRLGKLAVGTHMLKFMSNDGTYLEKQLVIEK